MDKIDITIALTSCGRYDSLEKTILSLWKSIDLEKYEKVMTEDSQSITHINKIVEANKNWFLKWWKIIYTKWSNQWSLYKCHHYALKQLYWEVNTKYVFHCEDDQIFKVVENDYIYESKEILEQNKNIWIVLLRDIIKDFWLKKTWLKKSRYYELLTDEEFIYNNKKYLYCTKSNNFSLQPWLRRTEEMKKIMFWFEDYVNEDLICSRYNELWLITIIPIHGLYNHIEPLFNSTKNIKNLWFFNFIYSTLKWTLKYRIWLLIKYIIKK